VNATFLDGRYCTAWLFHEHEKGTLGWRTFLLTQCNDSRPAFTRLILFVTGLLTGGNHVAEMCPSFLTACATAWNLAWICRKQALPAAWWIGMAVLLFASVQADNWLWGIQLIMFVPPLCITACARLSLMEDAHRWLRTAGCIVAAVCSTYSFANGMLCWAVVLALVPLIWTSVRERTVAALVCVSACALNLFAYFHEYIRAQPSGTTANAWQIPGQAFLYEVYFHTSAFAAEHPAFAWALLLPLAVLAAYALATVRRLGWKAVAPWACLGAYALISGPAAMAGRVGGSAGASQAFESRYTTVSIYSWIAIAGLLALRWTRLGLPSLAFRRALAGLLLALGGLHLWASAKALDQLEGRERSIRFGRACVALLNAVEGDCTDYYPIPRQCLAGLREASAAYTRAGLSPIPQLAARVVPPTAPGTGIMRIVGHEGSIVRLEGSFEGDADAVVIGAWDGGAFVPLGTTIQRLAERGRVAWSAGIPAPAARTPRAAFAVGVLKPQWRQIGQTRVD